MQFQEELALPSNMLLSDEERLFLLESPEEHHSDNNVIQKLRKENFSLKLRVYLLEQKLLEFTGTDVEYLKTIQLEEEDVLEGENENSLKYAIMNLEKELLAKDLEIEKLRTTISHLKKNAETIQLQFRKKGSTIRNLLVKLKQVPDWHSKEIWHITNEGLEAARQKDVNKVSSCINQIKLLYCEILSMSPDALFQDDNSSVHKRTDHHFQQKVEECLEKLDVCFQYFNEKKMQNSDDSSTAKYFEEASQHIHNVHCLCQELLGTLSDDSSKIAKSYEKVNTQRLKDYINKAILKAICIKGSETANENRTEDIAEQILMELSGFKEKLITVCTALVEDDIPHAIKDVVSGGVAYLNDLDDSSILYNLDGSNILDSDEKTSEPKGISAVRCANQTDENWESKLETSNNQLRAIQKQLEAMPQMQNDFNEVLCKHFKSDLEVAIDRLKVLEVKFSGLKFSDSDQFEKIKMAEENTFLKEKLQYFGDKVKEVINGYSSLQNKLILQIEGLEKRLAGANFNLKNLLDKSHSEKLIIEKSKESDICAKFLANTKTMFIPASEQESIENFCAVNVLQSVSDSKPSFNKLDVKNIIANSPILIEMRTKISDLETCNSSLKDEIFTKNAELTDLLCTIKNLECSIIERDMEMSEAKIRLKSLREAICLFEKRPSLLNDMNDEIDLSSLSSQIMCIQNSICKENIIYKFISSFKSVVISNLIRKLKNKSQEMSSHLQTEFNAVNKFTFLESPLKTPLNGEMLTSTVKSSKLTRKIDMKNFKLCDLFVSQMVSEKNNKKNLESHPMGVNNQMKPKQKLSNLSRFAFANDTSIGDTIEGIKPETINLSVIQVQKKIERNAKLISELKNQKAECETEIFSLRELVDSHSSTSCYSTCSSNNSVNISQEELTPMELKKRTESQFSQLQELLQDCSYAETQFRKLKKRFHELREKHERKCSSPDKLRKRRLENFHCENLNQERARNNDEIVGSIDTEGNQNICCSLNEKSNREFNLGKYLVGFTCKLENMEAICYKNHSIVQKFVQEFNTEENYHKTNFDNLPQNFQNNIQILKPELLSSLINMSKEFHEFQLELKNLNDVIIDSKDAIVGRTSKDEFMKSSINLNERNSDHLKFEKDLNKEVNFVLPAEKGMIEEEKTNVLFQEKEIISDQNHETNKQFFSNEVKSLISEKAEDQFQIKYECNDKFPNFKRQNLEGELSKNHHHTSFDLKCSVPKIFVSTCDENETDARISCDINERTENESFYDCREIISDLCLGSSTMQKSVNNTNHSHTIQNCLEEENQEQRCSEKEEMCVQEDFLSISEENCCVVIQHNENSENNSIALSFKNAHSVQKMEPVIHYKLKNSLPAEKEDFAEFDQNTNACETRNKGIAFENQVECNYHEQYRSTSGSRDENYGDKKIENQKRCNKSDLVVERWEDLKCSLQQEIMILQAEMFKDSPGDLQKQLGFIEHVNKIHQNIPDKNSDLNDSIISLMKLKCDIEFLQNIKMLFQHFIVPLLNKFLECERADTVKKVRERNCAKSNSTAESSSLQAVGNLHDFELLKKEIEECIVVLKHISFCVNDSLYHIQRNVNLQKFFCQESLKSISNSCHFIEVCLSEAQRLTDNFSITSLPDKKLPR